MTFFGSSNRGTPPGHRSISPAMTGSAACNRARATCSRTKTPAADVDIMTPCGPFGLYPTLVELPGLDNGHQVVRMLQQGDVGKGIAVDDEQVRPLLGFDGSGLGRDPE